MDDFHKIVADEYKKGTSIQNIVNLTGRSRATVIRSAKRQNLNHPNRDNKEGAKIEMDSTLTKGALPMEPTKAQLAEFRRHCDENGLPFDLWRAFWHKTGTHSSFFVNKEAQEAQDNFAKDLLADIAKKSPRRKKRKKKAESDHLLVLPMADVHFGKWLCKEETNDEYNLNIVTERVREGTASLLEKARAFRTSDFVVCLGNDMLHTDDGKSTTSGTPQDTDGSWFQHFRVALQVMRGIVSELANKGDVHLVYVPSNHDWRSGFALSHAVAASFANHPHVHTGELEKGLTEVHRKYFVYGSNLIMFTHGDGAKEKDLHWLLATEAAEVWSKTKQRYIYLGHWHHKSRKSRGHNNSQLEKDKIGFTEIDTGVPHDPELDVYIEIVRSPTPADSWHHRKGYTGGVQAVECFLHHPTEGQVARFTQPF